MPDERAKRPSAMKGKLVGEKNPMYGRTGDKNPFYGKHHSAELMAQIAETRRQHPWRPTPEQREKQSQALKGKKRGAETRVRMSEAQRGNQKSLGKHWTPESRANKSKSCMGDGNGFYGKKHSLHSIQKMLKNNNQKGRRRRQTEPEKILEQILNEYFPSEYKYVGLGADVVIGGCRPDFINVNGKKKIIECFGDYYHSPKITGRPLSVEEHAKIDGYKEYGFSCLILWEKEIKKYKDEVIAKVKAFNADRSMQLHLKI